jgi:hypothetical protein
MADIALIGRARSGKDTVAARLVAQGYTRVAFADPLKTALLDMNPYVPTGYGVTVRLQALIADVGWDYAKDNYPEVRRLLQHTGQTVRGMDPGFWVTAALDVIAGIWSPVVVSDVRYPNEAEALRVRGFKIVRIVRPDTAPLPGGASAHDSETALDRYPIDSLIYNVGSLADLARRADALTTR